SARLGQLKSSPARESSPSLRDGTGPVAERRATFQEQGSRHRGPGHPTRRARRMSSDDSPDPTFHDLIGRVRRGDQAAAAELVRRYEPTIRRVARIRLADTRLQRVFDSLDICQSVLGSFFVRAALGQYDLDRPEQLLKLLLSMTRKKLIDHVRAQGAARRDFRRVRSGGLVDAEAPAADPSPSQQAAAGELLDEFRKRLSP